MSQTEMMRTLEALVSSVDGLRQVLNLRVPLVFGGFLALYTLIMAGIMSAFR